MDEQEKKRREQANAAEVAEIKEEWRQWALSHHGPGWVERHFEAEWERTKHMIL